MSELSFSQPERRSFLLPILLALAAIGLAIAIAIHFFPATTVNINHVHTDVLAQDIKFKGSSIVGLNEVDHLLIVATTIRVDNQLRVPISLDDYHLTLTGDDGAEVTSSAVTKAELAEMETNYPDVKPLMATPLQRDTAVEAGQATQGTLLFTFNLPKPIWDARKSAVVKVDLYHQPAIYATIPK